LSSKAVYGFQFPTWPLWLIGSAFFCIHACYLFELATSYFADLGGFERNVVWTIQHQLLGGRTYENPNTLPFAITQYGPAYYFIVGLLSSTFHIDPEEGRSIIQFARLFNLTLLMAMTTVVFLLVKYQLHKTAAAFAGLMSFIVMGQYFISGRPDALKAFFVLLSFYTSLRFVATYSLKWQTIAMFFASCALLTKQDGLIAFFPIFLFHLINKSPFFEWMKSAAICCAFGFLIAGLIVTQPFAVYNLIDGLKNGLSLSWFLSVFHNYFGYLGLVLLLATLGVMKLAQSNSKQAVLLASFLSIFTIFPWLFSLKFGSGLNYFNELIVLSILSASLLIRPLIASSTKYGFAILAGFLLVFNSVGAVKELVSVSLGNQEVQMNQYQSQEKVVDWLVKQEVAKHSVLCLISKQWEDHITNLASDIILIPQRDVMDQIFNAAPENQIVKQAKSVICKGNVAYIVSDKSTIPSFLGIKFVSSKPIFETGGYFVFEKPKVQ